MQEIVGVTANVMLVQDSDDNWQPEAELVIITSEVQYHLDEDFELKKRRRRDCVTIRILVNEASITDVIAALEKLRFDMQSQATAANNANLEHKAA